MYKLIKMNNDFVIQEKKTDLVIKKSSNRDSIYPLYRRLLGGSGFCGFTPQFFLQEIKAK